ncbi:unnamed protein product [Gongylonema pulchrum]|uniref:G_PROTEIN_RECEP_F1_2 domain-containing protein n=1 Tax=Gongylonema pulchrum TaxID=637853 RepID=A0A183ER38_9BILA|nr:unnamed protein product [Gongylonema pulchrum]
MFGTKRFIFLTLAIGFLYAAPLTALGFVMIDDELVDSCSPTSATTSFARIARNFGYISTAIIVVILNAFTFFLIRKKGIKRKSCTI